MVYHNSFTETLKVYHNPEHKWYYVNNLGDNEAIMFVQQDLAIDGGGGEYTSLQLQEVRCKTLADGLEISIGVPHTSFKNSQADKDAALRMSIEFRTFVVFN